MSKVYQYHSMDASCRGLTKLAEVLMERGIDLKLKPAHVFFFEQKEVEQ